LFPLSLALRAKLGIETGDKAANIEISYKIAQALEIPLTELVRCTEEEMNQHLAIQGIIMI